jgi:hypothetical protein
LSPALTAPAQRRIFLSSIFINNNLPA